MTDFRRSPDGSGSRPTGRAAEGVSPVPASIPNADILYALEAWAFNVMLECSGREEETLEMLVGGAVLDLRDLDRVLSWARQAATPTTVLRRLAASAIALLAVAALGALFALAVLRVAQGIEAQRAETMEQSLKAMRPMKTSQHPGWGRGCDE